MAKKQKKKLHTFPTRKPRTVQVADDLVKLHERNEKLKDKDIGTSFLDMF